MSYTETVQLELSLLLNNPTQDSLLNYFKKFEGFAYDKDQIDKNDNSVLYNFLSEFIQENDLEKKIVLLFKNNKFTLYNIINFEEFDEGESFFIKTKNENNNINVITSFYNGGTYLNEMLNENL